MLEETTNVLDLHSLRNQKSPAVPEATTEIDDIIGDLLSEFETDDVHGYDDTETQLPFRSEHTLTGQTTRELLSHLNNQVNQMNDDVTKIGIYLSDTNLSQD